jgi:hypothetical protein
VLQTYGLISFPNPNGDPTFQCLSQLYERKFLCALPKKLRIFAAAFKAISSDLKSAYRAFDMRNFSEKYEERYPKKSPARELKHKL